MKKGALKNKFEPILICILIFAAAAFIFAFLENSQLIIVAAICVCGVYLWSVFKPKAAGKVLDFCFRKRWAIALVIFGICVLFRLSGSSIGTYNIFLPEKLDEINSTIFGEVRSIRSDEWAVQTPTFFSQLYNNFGLYSNRMSVSSTNMVMDYYAPVWDITVIGKPLSWGYLLFGSSVGLSWYWCGQQILLFMLSLEMFLIITERQSGISAVGAFMIALSPNIQWWFLPHMPIVFLYAEALFVVGYHFFTATKKAFQILFSLASIIAVTGFALSIFPSIQVPCLYIVVALLVGTLCRDRSKITFTVKRWYMIAVPVVAVAGIMLHFYLTSWDAVKAVLNSAYPGRRVSTGGDRGIAELFTNLSSLTLPYKDINYLNNCEVSSYIHFAPFFVALAPRMFVRIKKDGKSVVVGAVLLATVVLSALFMVVGIPEWAAEITLLRFCNRMSSIYGWCAAIYTVYGLNVLLKYPDMLKKWQKIIYPVIYAIVCFAVTDENVIQYFDTFSFIGGHGVLLVVLALVGLSSILVLVLFSRRKLAYAAVLAIMVICGATINPIECGTTAITNHPLYNIVQELSAQDSDAVWLNCTDSFFFSNYLMAGGARVVNATNFYTDEGKWSIIDPEGEYSDITNRYANQTVDITEEITSVELRAADCIHINIDPATLKQLGVTYVFSDKDYTELFEENGISYSIIDAQDQYRIYKLETESDAEYLKAFY